MSYRTMLVHLDAGESSTNQLSASINLAHQHNAHLIGLYVIPPLHVYVSAEMPVPTELVEQHNSYHQELCDELKLRFDQYTQATDFVAEWRTVSAESTSVAETIIDIARTVDLVIIGQKDKDKQPHSSRELPEGVILGCSRPVIVVPSSGSESKSIEDIFVAWDGGAQATRAVFDALPLLRDANNVRVHRVNPDSRDRHRILSTPAELVNTLARHGVNISMSESVVAGGDVGDEILEYVKDTGSDLLVMGAYGHTRLREYLFGGATRKILQEMSTPVLMAH